MNDDELDRLVSEVDGPLPALTKDERRKATLMLRLVKAGVLERTASELHRRDNVLLFSAERPTISLKGKR